VLNVCWHRAGLVGLFERSIGVDVDGNGVIGSGQQASHVARNAHKAAVGKDGLCKALRSAAVHSLMCVTPVLCDQKTCM